MLAAGSTVLALLTLLSMWLIGRKMAAGWLVAIGAQFLWVPYDLWSHQPGFILITIGSVPVYVRGRRNFRRSEGHDGPVSYARRLTEEYLGRTGQPRDGQLDAAYMFEWAVLRDMLDRLEVILDDEDMPRPAVERVIRCMLYGSPSRAAAEQRMRQQDEMTKLLSALPPRPFTVPAPG